MKRLTLTVRGRVQGVFFRAGTQDEARRAGLTGWVRNVHDGDVEVVAEGTEHQLGALLKWCQTGGPPAARVDEITVTWGEASERLGPFHVRY